MPGGLRCRCVGGTFLDQPAEGELTFAIPATPPGHASTADGGALDVGDGGAVEALAQVVVSEPPSGDFNAWRERIAQRFFADAEDRSRPFSIEGLQGTAYDSWYDLGLLAVARIGKGTDGLWRVSDRQVPLSLRAEGERLPEHPGDLSQHQAPEIPLERPLPTTRWVGYQVTGLGNFTHHRLDSAPAPSAPPSSVNDEGRIVPGGTLSTLQLSDHVAWMWEVGYESGFLGGDATRAKYTVVPLGLGGRVLALNPACSIRPYAGWHLGVASIQMRVLDHPHAEDGWAPFGALEAGVQLFGNDSLGLVAAVRYDLSGATRFTQAPNLDPSGFSFELGLFLGGGGNPAALMTGAQFEHLKEENVPAEVKAILRSMDGHWKPIGLLLPEGSVVDVGLPPGSYRLRPASGIRLHAGGSEDQASGGSESDAQVVGDQGLVYAFVHHQTRVGAFAEVVGGGDRSIILEELDAPEWVPPPAGAAPLPGR